MNVFSGLWFRIWGVFPFFLTGGLLVFLLDLKDIKKSKSKRKAKKYIPLAVGSAILVASIGYFIFYINAIYNPKVNCADCIFVDSYRDSHVAPPIPVTDCYIFKDEISDKIIYLYLDSFSYKKVSDSELAEGQHYRVWYSEFGDIIVRVEPK